jgi:hypothetical protein
LAQRQKFVSPFALGKDLFWRDAKDGGIRLEFQWKRAATAGPPLSFNLRLETFLSPVVIMVFVFVAMVVVVAVAHFMAVPICLVSIAVSIPVPSYLPAAVPAIVAVMIISYHAGIVAEARVVILAEARIIAQTSVVRTPPLKVLPLALTV